jgi:hypothetical protein
MFCDSNSGKKPAKSDLRGLLLPNQIHRSIGDDEVWLFKKAQGVELFLRFMGHCVI